MREVVILVLAAVIVLSCLAFASLNAGGVEYESECRVLNVAPLINASSFHLTNKTVCIGESVGFSISVSDDNGFSDISSVMVVLSDDENMSENDILIQLNKVETVNATTAIFSKVWAVEGEAGLKNIFITANDSNGLSASNNGIKVGTIELNPMIGFEVKDGSGKDLTTINFPACPPGTPNVPSNQNPVRINNTGGVAINVYIYGTDFNLTGGDGKIPISNMKVNGIPMNTTPQLIMHIETKESSALNFSIDYPSALPPGTYKGAVMFEITS